jgi:hypothetical protein
LNWVRFCTERYLGRRTPGRKQLISKEDDPSCAFLRSHDALGYTKIFRRKTGAWRRIDPANTTPEGKSVLILRDPLETFVRASGKSLWRFQAYVGNVKFFSKCNCQKRIFHYDELITDPLTMLDLLEFMAIEPADGFTALNQELFKSTWADAAAQSRANYDVNQAGGGGAITKNNPTDFKFHQRALSMFERRMVWDFLRRHLSEDEMAILDRYEPDFAHPLSLPERFSSVRYFFG